MGDYYRALHYYDLAIICNRYSHELLCEAWNRIGYINFLLENYPNAAYAYQQYVKLCDENAYGWYNLGLSYYYLKRYDKAKDAFKKATEKKDDCFDCWFELGDIYLLLGDYEKAVKAFEKASKLKNDLNINVIYRLGWIYYKQGKYEDACNKYIDGIAVYAKIHRYYDKIRDLMEKANRQDLKCIGLIILLNYWISIHTKNEELKNNVMEFLNELENYNKETREDKMKFLKIIRKEIEEKENNLTLEDIKKYLQQNTQQNTNVSS